MLILSGIVFIIGYIFITLEHKFNTHKSAIALLTGVILWIITAFHLQNPELLSQELTETGAEIFNLIVFLLAAMTLVEILIHYRFFDIVRIKLQEKNLDDTKQFILVCIVTFFLSAILDNLTVTIVMLQISRKLFKGENLLVTACGIVIMANAGGAWSPLGDVTTIMIWLAGKFNVIEIIAHTFVPALLGGLAATFMLSRKIVGDTKDNQKDLNLKFSKGEKIIIGLCLASFGLPLIMSRFGLQPYFGLILGLGVVWIVIDRMKKVAPRETHLSASIDSLLQKTDLASIKFFIGILLAVSALKAIGVLEVMSHALLGEEQEFLRVMFGSTVLGLASSIVDNVPLTALSLDIIKLDEPTVWTYLAYSVGTGGSVLLIGSVAGVIASGIVKELTFGKYLKYATLPALVAFFVGVGVYAVQYVHIF